MTLWPFPVSAYFVIENDVFLTTQPLTSKSFANCFSYTHTHTHPKNFLLPTCFSAISWSFFFILIAKMLTMLGCLSVTLFYCTLLLSGLHTAYPFILLFLQRASHEYSCKIPWDLAKYLFFILYSNSPLLDKLNHICLSSCKNSNSACDEFILDYSVLLSLFPSPFLPCLHVEWPLFFTLIHICAFHIPFQNVLLTLGSYALSCLWVTSTTTILFVQF